MISTLGLFKLEWENVYPGPKLKEIVCITIAHRKMVKAHLPLDTPSGLTLLNDTQASTQCFYSALSNIQFWIPQSNPYSINKLRNMHIENCWSILGHFLWKNWKIIMHA